MQKNMIIAVGSGGLSAVASMAFLSGTPGALFLVYLSTLPIFLIAFSMGPIAATTAGLGGMAIAGLLGGIMTAGTYALLHALPALLVSRQSMLQRSTANGKTSWYPVGNALSILAILSAGMLALAGFYLAGSVGNLHETVGLHLADAFAIMLPGLGETERFAMVDMLASIFPGAMGSSWVLMIAVNAILAQTILVRMGKNLRPTPAFSDLVLPHWATWPLIATAVFALLVPGETRYLAQNVAMVLVVPYFFLGLSVVHWTMSRVRHTTILLSVFYLILFLSGWALLLVAAVGLIEQWAGIRNRFVNVADDHTTDLDA